VEVAQRENGWISVRDSKNKNRPEHLYTRDEWTAFVKGVKAGEFDFNPDAVESATVRLTT
jgi:hypothetical protein